MAHPKTTCEFCGRRLSAYALSRHQGTEGCFQGYWNRISAREFALPSGLRCFDAVLYTAIQFVKDAGLRVDESPIEMRAVWKDSAWDTGPNSGWLTRVAVGPAWFVIAVMVSGEVDLEKEAVYEQDILTLLQYFKDHDPDGSLALGLSVELDLAAKSFTDAANGEHWDVNAVFRVIRNAANEAVTHIL